MQGSLLDKEQAAANLTTAPGHDPDVERGTALGSQAEIRIEAPPASLVRAARRGLKHCRGFTPRRRGAPEGLRAVPSSGSHRVMFDAPVRAASPRALLAGLLLLSCP